MNEFVAALFAEPTTNIVIGLLIVLPLADWITGSLRAIADGSFTLSRFDVFVRTQLAGRTLPLMILLLLGRALTVAIPTEVRIPGLDLSLLTGAGILAAVPFLAVTAKSIVDNANPSVRDVVPTVGEGDPA